MKKIQGKISISRWTSGGDQKHGISIDIEDSTTGCKIADLEMTVEEFAHCLFGSSYCNCEMEVYDAYSKVGKFPIRKTVWIEYTLYGRDPKMLNMFAKESIKEHEIDGWQYNNHQLGNSHYRKKDTNINLYPVFLIKYVDTIEEKQLFEKMNNDE